ncbi:MAG: exodeoxyribonuclease VII small subunit [Anaerolineaceae bacterium]|nr:exodeoxyribonuclease VII small subunit [Anaerolineaceae bacterium]
MQKPSTSIDKLTYEQAFLELETIVSSLETSQPSLENAVSLFERGQNLAQRCAALLDQAELKVKQLSDQNDLADTDEEEA